MPLGMYASIIADVSSICNMFLIFIFLRFSTRKQEKNAYMSFTIHISSKLIPKACHPGRFDAQLKLH